MAETTDDKLRLHIEAIERLEEEKRGISDDIKDRYLLAKAEGYDPKIMRQIVRLRKMQADDRKEMEAILDLYKAALGARLMTALTDIARHWAKQTEQGRGIRLEAGALDVLNAIGVGELIAQIAAEQQRKLCQERNLRNQSIFEANTGSSGAPIELISKSSDTTPSADATEALQRVQRMLKKPKR